MEQAGLLDMADTAISELSEGSSKGISGACLAQKADLYLMDEPFVGVDAATEDAILKLLTRMRDAGKSVIIVHHDLQTAYSFFDHIVLLRTRLVASGPKMKSSPQIICKMHTAEDWSVLSRIGDLMKREEVKMKQDRANESECRILLGPWFPSQDPVLQAFMATTFTWLLTAAGFAGVLFQEHEPQVARRHAWIHRRCDDRRFVLVAACTVHCHERSTRTDLMAPTCCWFCIGALFLYGLDKFVPTCTSISKRRERRPKTDWKRSTLLVLAITLHNIPEGLAVGVAFGAYASGVDGASLGAALALAIGIGLQNFPEGLAVSMPLRRQGVSAKRAFWFGQLSAIVEPIAGVVGAVAVLYMQPLLPYALAFAAGAMIYVVIEEVVPETQRDRFTDVATPDS